MTAPHLRLFPGPTPTYGGAEFAILGSSRTAQVLVPLDTRSVTSAALVRHHAGMSTGERVKRQAAAAAARLGVLQPFLRHRWSVDRAGSGDTPSLHTKMEAVLGCAPLALSIAFGPPRPNQKPVVRAIDRDGRTVGFAKIGWDASTTALVEAEAATVGMAGLRNARHVTVPELLHLGDWLDHRIAIYSAVMGRPGRTVPSWEAFREIATTWPGCTQPIATAPFVARLMSRCRELASEGDETPLNALDATLSRWGEVELEIGGWHGDWTPWNTAARADGGVVVWDWERAEGGVPTAFDMLHYRIQPRAVASAFRARELLESVTGWPEITRTLGKRGAQAAAGLYLLEMSVRHAGYPSLEYFRDLIEIFRK